MISNLYQSTSLHALFRKSQFTIFAITFVICSCTFATISMFTMETYAKQNLKLLSQTVLERIQPAVVFKDRGAIDQILDDYTREHAIRSIHVYDPQQQLLAESTKKIANTSFLQDLLDKWFLHDPVKLMIVHHKKKVGELVLYGSSENILHFLKTIIIGLAISMFFIVIALLWSVNLTYRQIMQAIKPLTHIAQLVSDQKAYNLRFPNNHIKEFQNLNTVFNELLEEIQIWNNNLQKENRQLSFQAHHDQLTSLPNRHYFYEELLNIFENPLFRHNSALIFIDNNKFKLINDQFGHLAGDAVLREMAQRLKLSVRQEDFIARLGGDEFAIILHAIHHADHLKAIAEGLLASSEEPLNFNGEIIHFGFSLGIAFSQFAENPEDLVMQADQAMYKAKNLNPHWFLYKPEI
ncbi:diguanylate cyclase domain-containing protein [Acinetobacter venetianus]|uniref:diguanylate cyclase domain-containing protein n=1 Tax=Acinetobacter venetianus TaxID=52133 RepID=UPI0007782FE4|nr:diguanylate cyclase [Acinetobacter venetianus]KXZ66491.1 putative diguanylate cyclase YfiN [Acinetobacter venetianus]